MKLPRRDFLKSTLTASAAAALSAPAVRAAAAPGAAGREYYELRSYRLKAGGSRAPLDGFLEKALIPALNQRGVRDVGVFTEIDVDMRPNVEPTSKPKEDSPVWVWMAHASIESFLNVSADLNNDPAVQKAGADYLNVGKANPNFDRIDSWLLLAFTAAPKHDVPAHSRSRVASRVFEMRSYESFSEAKAAKKVEMFNAGEIPVMQEVGLSPIFFGQALAGRDLPHLTYMTSGADLKSHLGHWPGFNNHPTWLKLRNDPQYADTVTKNVRRFLAPTSYSQV